MIDATDIKAHRTASSLNKGGMTSTLHVVCHSKGGPLRLHLNEGQCVVMSPDPRAPGDTALSRSGEPAGAEQ